MSYLQYGPREYEFKTYDIYIRWNRARICAIQFFFESSWTAIQNNELCTTCLQSKQKRKKGDNQQTVPSAKTPKRKKT